MCQICKVLNAEDIAYSKAATVEPTNHVGMRFKVSTIEDATFTVLSLENDIYTVRRDAGYPDCQDFTIRRETLAGMASENYFLKFEWLFSEHTKTYISKVLDQLTAAHWALSQLFLENDYDSADIEEKMQEAMRDSPIQSCFYEYAQDIAKWTKLVKSRL